MTDPCVTAEPNKNEKIGYDPADPSKLFTHAQIAYIRSIDRYMTKEEIEKCLSLESFTLSTYDRNVLCDDIPGIRADDDIVFLYVENRDRMGYIKFKDNFLDLVFDETFLYESRKYVISTWRVTIPNGYRFYPFKFGSQEGKWRALMLSAAAALEARVGEFRNGEFCTSDGGRYSILELDVEKMGSETDLDTW